ncbi:ATPase with role in protein import into the ER [Ceratobasidium sp. 428]|nr:ATPase with role in protein import into the ER [Ceratobasidium sp. 428]
MKFNTLNLDLLLQSLEPVHKVLKDAKLEKQDMDEIVLVGGSTCIPKIQALLSKFFDNKELSRGINPDEAVAFGAALQAAVLAGESGVQEVVLLNMCPLSIGIKVEGISLATRGVPQIKITFSLDVNRLVHIDAQEIGSGHIGLLTVSKKARATADNINRMIYKVNTKEREKAEAIKALKSLNNLQQVVSGLERQVNNARKTMNKLDKLYCPHCY